MFDVNAYKKQSEEGKYKTVKAPSGFDFMIKKLSQKVILLLRGWLAVHNVTQIKNHDVDFEAKKKEFNAGDYKKQCEFAEDLIINGVVEPKIYREYPEPASNTMLLIDDISEDDYNFLTTEISNFAAGIIAKKKEIPVNTKECVAAGSDGEAVRVDAVGDIE